jgi:hypothetical protein
MCEEEGAEIVHGERHLDPFFRHVPGLPVGSHVIDEHVET